MTILDAIIQGIVQGLTEFLPVSSSGHLAITQHITGVAGEGNLFFNVMLHVGTLVAVVAFYHKLIWSLIREMNYERNLIVMLIIALLPLFIMFIPVPGTDMKVKDLAELFSGAQILLVTAFSLLLTSILLAVGAYCNRKNSGQSFKHMRGTSAEAKGRESYTVADALCVGLMQVAAALLPGLSRSGSTLAVGEMRGINKQKALDFTFVLGTPSILAAALLEGKDAVEEGIHIEPAVVIVGIVVSAVVGYLSIWLFKWFLKSDKMIVFIVYTALVGLALTVISFIEMAQGVNLFTGQPAVLFG